MGKRKMTASEKAAIEKAAHEYNLQKARELLKKCGYVQGPGDRWTPGSMGKQGGNARAADQDEE